MKKAIGLTRVSTSAQAEKGRGGLDGQRAEIERIAATHDLTIIQ